eukprot:1182338-Prorocentrum_minimum.AAC.1
MRLGPTKSHLSWWAAGETGPWQPWVTHCERRACVPPVVGAAPPAESPPRWPWTTGRTLGGGACP